MTKPDDERPVDKPLSDSGKVASTMLAALRELLDAYGKTFPRIIGYDAASGGPIIADDGAHRIMGNAENAIAQAEAAGIKED